MIRATPTAPNQSNASASCRYVASGPTGSRSYMCVLIAARNGFDLPHGETSVGEHSIHDARGLVGMIEAFLLPAPRSECRHVMQVRRGIQHIIIQTDLVFPSELLRQLVIAHQCENPHAGCRKCSSANWRILIRQSLLAPIGWAATPVLARNIPRTTATQTDRKAKGDTLPKPFAVQHCSPEPGHVASYITSPRPPHPCDDRSTTVNPIDGPLS